MSDNHELTKYKKLIDEEVGDVEVQNLKTRHLLTSPSDSKRRRNGIPCCCKCVLITLAIFLAFWTFIFTCTYFFIKDGVQHLTVTTPHAQYPIVDMTDAELVLVKDRVTLFVDELRAKRTPNAALIVTQDEINGFIGQCDYLRGNMLVTLKKNRIFEEYSLPTEMLPGGEGRYFVGSDYVDVAENGKVEMKWETAAAHEDWFDGPLLFAQLEYLVNNKDHDNNMLELYLTKGSFFGQDAPEDYIDKHENLLKDFYLDPDNEDAVEVVEGIESVTIEDGKIVVKPRSAHD